MNITDLSEEIHKNAVAKGFWEGEPFNVGEKLMLVVSEISEALEADRNGRTCVANMNVINGWRDEEDFKEAFKEQVKDTFEDELADAIIRLLDLSKKMDVDIEAHIKAKMRYNAGRPYKHGKRY